jgi:hypothetical protein
MYPHLLEEAERIGKCTPQGLLQEDDESYYYSSSDESKN